MGIWLGFREGHPLGTYHAFNPKPRKISLTKDATFLVMSFGEWNTVEKPTVVPMSYEGSDDEKVKVISGNDENNNNNYNVVNDFKSKDEEGENFFED